MKDGRKAAKTHTAYLRAMADKSGINLSQYFSDDSDSN